MARNISLESINTREYIKDAESTLSVHNHFWDDDESDTMLEDRYGLESKIRRSKEMVQQRIQQHFAQQNSSNINNSGGNFSSPVHIGAPYNKHNQCQDFSKSSSNVQSIQNKALANLSPGNTRKIKSPNSSLRNQKPPLPPAYHQIQSPIINSIGDSIKISEQEIIEEESQFTDISGHQQYFATADYWTESRASTHRGDAAHSHQQMHPAQEEADEEAATDCDINEEVFYDIKDAFHNAIQNIDF